mmetsp:Transcript_30562/g.86392  ORF Transcript_30562/g.86392 Transcript_30562/m.86392 type:complete len:842 (+) Transcript_30562:220-2745(+)|eukprot:CAMPEP_0117679584 /NCGR_PEP_ID=MMETSP0804-20121206/17892_1 /TAXON_ID=1074897 /ORGANISM="Tetraselmis astigmatica, Strain CCMP880" /LENGTH=841 /DNA_ID=CAMNT_0005489015 /DNA_START=198 /DNA_END=2723 /DNA_ORIENTATION=-
MPAGQQEWHLSNESAATAATAAGGALLSVGAASLKLVAGTLSAGYNTISTAAAAASSTAAATGDGSLSSDRKEKVRWAKFDVLDFAQSSGDPPATRNVLLLGYAVGFQIWDVHAQSEVRELLSLRDATVRCAQPLPAPLEADPSSSPLAQRRPALAVVPCEGSPFPSPRMADRDGSGRAAGKVKGSVEIHSLGSQCLLHMLTFHSRVISVAASPRVVAVSLDTQVIVHDANSLQSLFTTMTYLAPSSLLASHEGHVWSAPLALGPRWLAFASSQATQQPAGYAAPQSINGSGRQAGNAGYRDLVKSMAAQAAVSSGKQLKAGLNWMGDTGYKFLSSQYSSWAGKHPPGEGDGSIDQMGKSPENGFGDSMHSQVAGTVMVRDIVRRTTIAHFRAHTSPLSLLSWDPSGLLLVTASVYGHSINVFQVCPAAETGSDVARGAVHLYKLSRGLTPALITCASFSCNSEWLAVSSGRGTTHLFHLATSPGCAGLHLSPLVAQRGARADPRGQRQQQGQGQQAPLVQHMGAVGRLRSTSGWAARVPGAPLAAAAAGLYAGGPGTAGPTVGAISTRFVLNASPPPGEIDSGPAEMLPFEESAPPSELTEQLLIAGPDGILSRYRLWLPAEATQVHEEDSMYGTSPASISSASLDGDSACGESDLGSEVTARLDVCRRSGWPERDDVALVFHGHHHPQTYLQLGGPEGAAKGPQAAVLREGRFPRMADSEDQRHEFIANAEICRHPGRAPLWAAAPQFHFLEIQAQGARPHGSAAFDSVPPPPAGVEELPTRRVDVVRGELLPSGTYWSTDPLAGDPASGGPSSSRPASACHWDDMDGAIAQVEAFELQ